MIFCPFQSLTERLRKQKKRSLLLFAIANKLHVISSVAAKNLFIYRASSLTLIGKSFPEFNLETEVFLINSGRFSINLYKLNLNSDRGRAGLCLLWFADRIHLRWPYKKAGLINLLRQMQRHTYLYKWLDS